MSEADVFFLRKLHFLIEFCWNTNIYKPILKYFLARYDISPVDVLIELCGDDKEGATDDLEEFWKSFDDLSHNEWFDSPQDIETYFAEPANLDRLLNGEFEKLNILFCIIALRDFKLEFDAAFRQILGRKIGDSDKDGRDCANLTFAIFPPLKDILGESKFIIAPALAEYFDHLEPLDADSPILILLHPEDKRAELLAVLNQTGQQKISKILDTQGFYLSDLSMTLSVQKNSKGYLTSAPIGRADEVLVNSGQ